MTRAYHSRLKALAGPATGLALLAATFLTYLPVTRLGFIDFDDPAYVVNEPHVTGGLTWPDVAWAFRVSNDNGFPFTPLARLSHLLDYAMFGPNAGWHHAVSVLFHALAALMLYAFLARSTRSRWPALLVAAVFALHPMRVQSVAWISERKDVLCAFFWFAALWAWVRYRERPTKTNYLAALILFTAGLMSKPMMVTFPLLLPFIDVWPLQRRVTRKIVLELLPFAVLSALFGILTVLVQHTSLTESSIEAAPFTARLENALVTPFIYIYKTFWPTDLSIVYSWSVQDLLWPAIFAGLAIAGISAAVWWQRGKRPYLVTGWFWFLITLLPVLGLVQSGPQPRADRYTYIPATGLLIVVAWGGAEVVKRIANGRRWVVPAAGALAGAACLALALSARAEEQYWDSAQSLFRHAIAIDDRNYLAWEYLGSLTDLSTELGDRIECYRKAISIRPDLPDLRANLGAALLQAEEIPESIAELETALRIDPRDTPTRCFLGAAFLGANRISEATAQMELAVRNDPNSAMAHNDLAVALWRTPGRAAEAKKELEAAIELRPDYSLPHSNLGLVLLATPGRLGDAVSQFVHALSLYPDDATAHFGLSQALTQQPFSDPQAAQAHLNSAHQIVQDPVSFERFETLRLDYGAHR